jgi:hypothetical protein
MSTPTIATQFAEALAGSATLMPPKATATTMNTRRQELILIHLLPVPQRER